MRDNIFFFFLPKVLKTTNCSWNPTWSPEALLDCLYGRTCGNTLLDEVAVGAKLQHDPTLSSYPLSHGFCKKPTVGDDLPNALSHKYMNLQRPFKKQDQDLTLNDQLDHLQERINQHAT